MMSFSAEICIIGVNPYVLVPQKVLDDIFAKAGKNKGAIPVKGSINGHNFIQTLVKYSGKWRLYINTSMRKSAGIDVGDMAEILIEYDNQPRLFSMHEKLKKALDENQKAKEVFYRLNSSRQKEIIRYINFLKSEEAVDKNVKRAIDHLLGNDRFVGRDKP
jgi:hypothetical protein